MKMSTALPKHSCRNHDGREGICLQLFKMSCHLCHCSITTLGLTYVQLHPLHIYQVSQCPTWMQSAAPKGIYWISIVWESQNIRRAKPAYITTLICYYHRPQGMQMIDEVFIMLQYCLVFHLLGRKRLVLSFFLCRKSLVFQLCYFTTHCSRNVQQK